MDVPEVTCVITEGWHSVCYSNKSCCHLFFVILIKCLMESVVPPVLSESAD